jgi:ribosome-binding factor A
MTAEPGLRARRVATAIRERLTQVLSREVSDPTLAGVVVTDVSLPDDLSVAWVKCRLLVGGEDPAKRRAAVASLARVAGRVRRGLGGALRLKRLPELRFAYDTGADAARRIEDILNEIAHERETKGGG